MAFQPPNGIDSVADAYIRLRLDYDPTLGYSLGLPPSDNMHLPDRSPAALLDLHAEEDALLQAVTTVGPGSEESAEVAVLLEELESRHGLRVCRTEYWDVSHMQGWQIDLPALAETLAATTPEERERILRLWRTFPQYVSTDIANLRAGLAQGYTVPKTVVTRVLRQLDALIATPSDASPFYAPARSGADSGEFAAALRQEVSNQILPSIRKYAEFLRQEYLPRARETLGLSALNKGGACYQAFLRRYTTTEDTPRSIFAAGQKMAKQSTKDIQGIGAHLYRTKDLAAIIDRSRSDPRDRFASAAELLDFTDQIVSRSERMSRPLFSPFPSQPVIVKPMPAYQQGSGVNSSYEANPDLSRPATFWIASDQWRTETRGTAEITAVHETVPGHQLQIATSQESHPAGVLSKLVFNAAYSEGWAIMLNSLPRKPASMPTTTSAFSAACLPEGV